MAGVTIRDFVETVRRACDESGLAVSYDVHIQDNATVKIKVFLKAEAFISAYFNPDNQNCSFALIRHGRRIYGADNAFVGWHVHPFESPDEHILCSEVSFAEFLHTVEQRVEPMSHRDAT
jgi:hypothetical protein